MRLWIDTDVGDNPDDAVALLAASAYPSVELVGVSVVGEDAPRRVALAQSLVPANVVDGADRGHLLESLLIAQPDVLLAIGPLTNVATLVPLGARLPKLVVMGGVLRPVFHRGELRHVERNFGADPLAAGIVVSHAAPMIVPLDVTTEMALDVPSVDRLVAARPELGPMVMEWLARLEQPGAEGGDRKVVLHDPLALLAAVGDPCVGSSPAWLEVDPRTGALRENPRGTRCEVVDRVDRRAALATILALVEAT